MLRALVSIAILLASLLALAKYAVVSPDRTSHDASAAATVLPTAEQVFVPELFSPPGAIQRIAAAKSTHANGAVIQRVEHTEVIFDDDDLPSLRMAARFRGRRFVSPPRTPQRSAPPAHVSPPPASDPPAANVPTPAVRPTPAGAPRANEPTPALRPSTKPHLREPTPARRPGAETIKLENPAAAPTPTLEQPLEEPVGQEQVAETIEESQGLPPGVDPWYEPPTRWNQTLANRRQNIRQCLDFYYTRPLNTKEHSPWSIMHTMVGWGSDSQILVGGPEGPRRSAVEWLCSNGVSDGVRLLEVENGKLAVKVGPGLQGHDAQFLALLAQARVSRQQPIHVDGKSFTVDDLIAYEQKNCRSGKELTFYLIGLSHYLHTDARWTDSQGQVWDFPRLIREEMAQPINGVTCGGTHRLMGLHYAVRRRAYQGHPIDGDWARANAFVQRYQQVAFSMQNRDGSLSSNFFRGRGDWGGIDRKIKTTGHTLEWLVFSLQHAQLQDPRVVRAVDMLTNMLMQNRYYEWEKGPIGHAIRALSLYDERVFGGHPGDRAEEFARRHGGHRR